MWCRYFCAGFHTFGSPEWEIRGNFEVFTTETAVPLAVTTQVIAEPGQTSRHSSDPALWLALLGLLRAARRGTLALVQSTDHPGGFGSFWKVKYSGNAWDILGIWKYRGYRRYVIGDAQLVILVFFRIVIKNRILRCSWDCDGTPHHPQV